ncbi:hypothetical protein GC176_27230 [bacterium]|nr:hypothetical protein [bacterium]
MSTIGAAAGGAPINPYAGNVRAALDTDASKSDSADRAAEAAREAFSGQLAEPDKTEGSGDRDADGTYAGPGPHQEQPRGESDSADESARQSGDAASAADDADSTANHAGERVSCDGHRGTLIDFDV